MRKNQEDFHRFPGGFDKEDIYMSMNGILPAPEDIKRVKGLGFLHDKTTADCFNARVITRNGRLQADEIRAIVDAADPAQEVPLDPESVVSMNFWGFTPWIFEEMDRYFREFLQGLSP